MRSAERELAEMERKKMAADAMSSANVRPRSSADVNKERMLDLTHQIAVEAKRLANTRAQLAKLKSTTGGVAPIPMKSTSVAGAKEGAGKKTSSNEPKASGGTIGGSRAQVVPEGLLPELCK
jgi:hypothetical protein